MMWAWFLRTPQLLTLKLVKTCSELFQHREWPKQSSYNLVIYLSLGGFISAIMLLLKISCLKARRLLMATLTMIYLTRFSHNLSDGMEIDPTEEGLVYQTVWMTSNFFGGYDSGKCGKGGCFSQTQSVPISPPSLLSHFPCERRGRRTVCLNLR